MRVREGGEILEGSNSTAAFACMLAGPDRGPLFILAAEWRGFENVDDALASWTGQVLVTEAPAPGVGWP